VLGSGKLFGCIWAKPSAAKINEGKVEIKSVVESDSWLAGLHIHVQITHIFMMDVLWIHQHD